MVGDLTGARAVGLGVGGVGARRPSTMRLYMQNAEAMRTASCVSPSVAPASSARVDIGAGEVARGRAERCARCRGAPAAWVDSPSEPPT